MVDLPTVCCMCGDIGFPDKIFRCNKCLNRFQHSYCSNYYSESSEPIEVCDWCQTEGIKSTRHGGSSKNLSLKNEAGRSEYSSGDKIKQHHDHHQEGTAEQKAGAGKNTGAPSPRTSTRRYKLLKDVMC